LEIKGFPYVEGKTQTTITSKHVDPSWKELYFESKKIVDENCTISSIFFQLSNSELIRRTMVRKIHSIPEIKRTFKRW